MAQYKVPFWSYFEKYLKVCCNTIGKPCISVGIIRLVEDVTAMVARDLIARGEKVNLHEVRIQILDTIYAMHNMRIAHVVDGAVVNFDENVVRCDKPPETKSRTGVAKNDTRRKTLLDFIR